MIIKKPYEFLIKHFKIIHIVAAILGVFVLLKNSSLANFVKDFVTYGVYISMDHPISEYIPFYIFFLLGILSFINVTLVLLLKHKSKPWKLYLIPTITYLGLLVVYFLLIVYFNGYNGSFERTQISLYKDLLNILTILQIPSIVLYLVRFFGLDLKRFNFQNDDEFLQLDDKDQLELEININVDKASIKRTYKKIKRNLGYFVEENKKLVIGFIVIVVVITGVNIYKKQFVENKSYSQFDTYHANGYSMKIKNVYYTDKDKSGKVIDKKYAFVIVQVIIRNNMDTASFKTDDFHLYNGVENYTDVSHLYSKEFDDLGKIYSQQTVLHKGQITRAILIYKVNKKLDKNRFVLFYQEKYGESQLRKIKTKIEDVSTIKDNGVYKLGEEIKINIGSDTTESLAPDAFSIKDSIKYVVQDCDAGLCVNNNETLYAGTGNKILAISYMTEAFESKDIIDFSTKYGKINYIDNNNKNHSVKMDNATGKDYLGQYAYVKVPADIENALIIELEYTIRNNRYTYRIKG